MKQKTARHSFDQQSGKELTQFLSTPSARRATVLRDTFDYDISISIHALREEGDTASWSSTTRRT